MLATMLLVGLTGGIGSGKSTVAELLASRGAVILDADDFARRAVEAGTPGFDRVVERFGSDVVGPDGGLDREALAQLVFADPAARLALEAIVHPEVRRLFLEALEPRRSTDQVVVYVVPLLAELDLSSMFDVVVTVSADEDTRVERLVTDRAMDGAQARARVRAQVSDDRREAVAQEVIHNNGSLRDLERAVDGLWQRLGSESPDPTR
jgi:dephospho-CoA kinase